MNQKESDYYFKDFDNREKRKNFDSEIFPALAVLVLDSDIDILHKRGETTASKEEFRKSMWKKSLGYTWEENYKIACGLAWKKRVPSEALASDLIDYYSDLRNVRINYDNESYVRAVRKLSENLLKYYPLVKRK